VDILNLCYTILMDKALIEQKIKEVAAKIVREHKPEKVILFGSWAWGHPGPDSDVDLFVVKDVGNTRELARKIDGSIFPRPFPMDLIVYKPDQVKKRLDMGDFFITDILSKGIILYGS